MWNAHHWKINSQEKISMKQSIGKHSFFALSSRFEKKINLKLILGE